MVTPDAIDQDRDRHSPTKHCRLLKIKRFYNIELLFKKNVFRELCVKSKANIQNSKLDHV
jgi:hypothetical protein